MTEELAAYMDGWMEGFDWDGSVEQEEAFFKEGVDSFNEEFKKNFDSHEAWISWLRD